METEQQTQIIMEAEEFALAMFNYVFPRRFDKHKIPRRFDGTSERQPPNIYFRSDIGSAVLQICYMHRDSFYNRFLLEYPDYLADDITTLFNYCKRCAVELYDEDNITNSLLMFSSMLIEMVSYCLMMSVEKCAIFVNSADKYWSSIFVGQFASAFYASGGWKTLKDESHEKARMYEKTKQKYPTHSCEDGPFHYWAASVNPKILEAFPLENGYFCIRDRICQINKFDGILCPVFQGIACSNSEAEREVDVLTAQLCDPFGKLSLQENEDLKSKVLKNPGSVPERDTTSMDVDESSMVKKRISEENNLILKFKDKTFFSTGLDGVYLEQLFESPENTRILLNDVHYLELMKYTVNNSKTPDTKELVNEARRIITEATSSALNIPTLQNQPTDTSSVSSKHFEKIEDTLQETHEKDELLHAGKVKFTDKLASQQEENPDSPYSLNMDDTSSPEKEYGPEPTERNLITLPDVKMAVEASEITLQVISQINDCIKGLRTIIETRYINHVLQHLNTELSTTFPVVDTHELDDISFPSTRQGTNIMIELMNISYTLTNRIQEMFEGLPVSFTTQLKKNWKKIISGRTGIRIAISTLERSRSAPSDVTKVSRYCKYLIRVLIYECAYFLRLIEKVKEVEEKSVRDSTNIKPKKSRVRKTPKKSASRSSSASMVSPKGLSEADNRKRGKHTKKKSDALPSIHEMVDAPTGLAAADDSSNSPVCSLKRLRLPLAESEKSVQMSDSQYREENVKDSSASE